MSGNCNLSSGLDKDKNANNAMTPVDTESVD